MLIKIQVDEVSRGKLNFNECTLEKTTLLFGGNGAGKSTFIRGILEHKFKVKIDKPTMMFKYINSESNFKYIDPLQADKGAFILTAVGRRQSNKVSEGQAILYSLSGLLEMLITENYEKDALVLLDEVDSGLSDENVLLLCNLIKVIQEKKPSIQFVIAFNNYLFAREFGKVLSMYTGEYLTFKNYDEFLSILLRERKALQNKSPVKIYTDKVAEMVNKIK